LLLPAAAVLAWQRRARSRGDAFALAWALAPLVLLSLFPAKRHLYLLPAYPGAALLVGRWLAWSRRPAAAPHPPLRAWSRFGRGATGATLVAGSLAAACVAAASHGSSELVALATPPMHLAAAAALALAAAAGTVLLVPRRRAAAWEGGLLLAAATLLLLLGTVHPLQSAGHDASRFYEGVERRVVGERLAVLDGVNFAPELRLADASLRRVLDPTEVVAGEGGEVTVDWLLAEQQHLERSRAAGLFEPVLRYEPALGETLLLLRARGDLPRASRVEAPYPAPPNATVAPPRRGPVGRPQAS
jgi:4-amino-4-deoxy-L-arabinose transferase-like glycosyltransferase